MSRPKIVETVVQKSDTNDPVRVILRIHNSMIVDTPDEKNVDADGYGSTVEIARTNAYVVLANNLLDVWQNRKPELK